MISQRHLGKGRHESETMKLRNGTGLSLLGLGGVSIRGEERLGEGLRLESGLELELGLGLGLVSLLGEVTLFMIVRGCGKDRRPRQ